MTKFSSSVLIVAISFPVITAQGMPISHNPNRSGLVVQVADGCGFNKYRDVHRICRQIGSAGWSAIEDVDQRLKRILLSHRKSPLLMLWTAPPPARECHEYGCS